MTPCHNVSATPYLDFHTHSKGCEAYRHRTDVIAVQSLHITEHPHERADYVTWGIHPYPTSEEPSAISLLQEKIATSPKPTIAIGECGWDKRATKPLDQQIDLVRAQVELGIDLHLPIIFHIVGAWHLLLAERKRYQSSATPWIVHGFRGKESLARQLYDAGIWVSLHPIAPPLGLPYFFLESDDTAIPIEAIYQKHKWDNETKRAEVISFFHTVTHLHSPK